MRKLLSTLVLLFAASACFAGVTVTYPASGATVGSPVHFVASATGSTTISAMIVYIDGVEQYRTYTNQVNTYISMGSGWHTATISAWDNWGGFYTHQVSFNASGTSVGVTISSPSSGATVGSPVHFVAAAHGSTTIASMIIYVDNVQQYLVYAPNLDTYLSIPAGAHQILIKAWDQWGGIYQLGEGIWVSGGSSTSTTTSSSSGSTTTTAGNATYDAQALSGWGSCTVCAGAGGSGPSAGYYMWEHQGSPSLGGNSSKFSIWGSTPYSDVLWWKQIIDGDLNPTANNAAHHYVYDAYFYIDNPGAAQALEFDINHFVNGHSLIFGTQCNIRGGNVWDVWDNQASRWVHTGKYCGTPSAYTWHHVTLEMERATDGGDWLHYVSITLDGNKTYIGYWYPPASTSWKGITVNFQMDGNYAMQPYNVWLDHLTFSWW